MPERLEDAYLKSGASVNSISALPQNAPPQFHLLLRKVLAPETLEPDCLGASLVLTLSKCVTSGKSPKMNELIYGKCLESCLAHSECCMIKELGEVTQERHWPLVRGGSRPF